MASRSLNRVILIGNLTRDPELKYTPNGTAVCTFGVATNRSWTTHDGQIKEDTQFHRIVAWQKLAELTGKLLTKGRKVYLEGRITYRSFVGNDGQQRTIAEIIMDDFIVFGDGKRTGAVDTDAGPVSTASNHPTAEPVSPVAAPVEAKQEETVNPEDIPF
jgi:single-strand DNA-binding protein